MKLFICSYNAPTGRYAELKGLGFTGIRINNISPKDIREMGEHGLEPLVIVDNATAAGYIAEWLHQEGVKGAIEFVNEPNLNSWNPGIWANRSRVAYMEAKNRNPEVTFVSGGISNLGKGQLKYLKTALDAGLQCDAVGYHRYQTEYGPSHPLKGYASRVTELQAIQLMVGPQTPLWCTEIGWHTFPQKRRTGPFGLFYETTRCSDEDVAYAAAWEKDFLKSRGVAAMAWYQITDGPDQHNFESFFGITRLDGTLKPVAHAFRS